MRRSGMVCVLMITLLLSACGGGKGNLAQELALTVRTAYSAAKGCTGRMKVVADYGQRVYTYTLSLAADGQETVLTVVQPEEIAGIVARVKPGESWLEYDGAVLETGPLSREGLTPLGAVPALLEAARSGFMESCGMELLGERQTLRVFCRDPAGTVGAGLETMLWFDADTHMLVRGEILSDGYRVILCEFEEFSLS